LSHEASLIKSDLYIYVDIQREREREREIRESQRQA
ncbi:hypothetical protein EE612_036523, partial [Oryza sativa]